MVAAYEFLTDGEGGELEAAGQLFLRQRDLRVSERMRPRDRQQEGGKPVRMDRTRTRARQPWKGQRGNSGRGDARD